MCLHVLAQVVASHEDPVANRAGELFGSRVGLKVPLQLIRAGEALPTKQPIADKGAVATVPPQVGLQVRCLGIGLATARDVAVVEVLLLGVVRALAHPFGLLAIRAPAGGLARTPGHGAP